MSEPRRILLVGATGLVGRKIIARGRDIPGRPLVALARKELQLPRGARMELVLAPVEEWVRSLALIGPNTVICALGTTQAKSGKAGLTAVDRDLVENIADSARKVGTDHFVHISSVGAQIGSRHDYLDIKGQAEQRLRKIGFRRLDILRPGLLLGQRWNDDRPAESVARFFSPAVNLLMNGAWRRYRSIHARDVAAAAIQASREQAGGTFVHEHDSIKRLAGRLQRELGASNLRD